MNLNSSRPLGDSTTVLDLADRDEMDDDMFPLTATKSWFTRDSSRRYLNFSPVIQEFVHKGSAEFGGRLVFEIGAVKACDLLFTVALQVRLGHWLPDNVVEALQCGTYTYVNPDTAWYYANGLGMAMIAKAEFMLDDQVLETVDGDFSNCFGLLFSDINTQFGAGIDAFARVPIQELNPSTYSETRVFPTTNGFISAILPFSFQRIRLRNGFPLASCREGTVRVAITLRPFNECVRIANGIRTGCNDTPLGKVFTFNTGGVPATVNVTASSTVPQFADARLVTYGMMVDGKLRKAMIHAPFDRMYRELQTFRFTEPKKYVVNTPSNGVVRLQFPIEVNGPIEEFIWFIRRKATAVNNEWTNYSNRVESEIFAANSDIYYPLQSMLVSANIQVNGISIIQAEGEFFRREVAKRHRGGIIAYSAFVYGYSFAQNPGRQNPSGWMNASRSSDVRIRMDIRPPPPDINDPDTMNMEFEVCIFSLAMNWVRFENGIVNKVFSS
jgi:hypothetical protein